MTYYLAWVDEGEEFAPSAHSVEDVKVFSFTVEQSEAQFATLTIAIQNPRIGLLASGRKQWAWFSEDIGAGPVALFYGRLIALPDYMEGELIALKFLARPVDYDEQRATLAASLRALPYFDPVMVPPERREDVDQVLEARPVLWHTDRVTHVVTVSDIIAGEDGTADFGTTVFNPSLSYGQRPATVCNVRAEIRWKQAAIGDVDLTTRLYAAFAAVNSVRDGCIASYTGNGLQAAWPKVGTNIGAGWSFGVCTCERVDGYGHGSRVAPLNLNVAMQTGGFGQTGNEAGQFTDGIAFQVDLPENAEELGWIPSGPSYTSTWDNWERGIPNYYRDDEKEVGKPSVAGFPNCALIGTLNVHYDVERDRIELVTFALEADVQAITNNTEDTVIDVDLTSGEVDQPIDAGGALPIGDLRRNSYMLTDRGKQTLGYLICLARARLLARARTARVSFGCLYEQAKVLSCRMNGTLTDPHLPGGEATGKIVGYSFGLDGAQGAKFGRVVLACSVGAGNLLVPAAGTPTWVDEGWVDPGWQAYSGGATAVTADVQYADYDTTPITDDGVDLFALDSSTAVDTLAIVDGAADQEAVLLGTTWHDTNQAISGLNEHMTKVALALVPLTTDEPLETAFEIDVDPLVIPRTIDLEAA